MINVLPFDQFFYRTSGLSRGLYNSGSEHNKYPQKKQIHKLLEDPHKQRTSLKMTNKTAQVLDPMTKCFIYSKTCLKRPLKKTVQKS